MRLTPAHAAKLARLAAGESLPRSRLPKALLGPLQQANVVRLQKSGSSYVVRGIPGKLLGFVEHHWGVRDLLCLAKATPENRTREMLAEIAGDSKALPSRPFEGIFIRSFGSCFVGDEPLAMTPPGCATLISLNELPRLRVETQYLVGIENVRCLWNFERARKYFPQLEGLHVTLALRWCWSAAWRQWLAGWSGHLLYFPDYDPAGLRIFAKEVLPYRADARLLIPADFEALLNKRGDRKLYVLQERLRFLEHHTDLVNVSDSLRKIRKGLEQESLLF